MTAAESEKIKEPFECVFTEGSCSGGFQVPASGFVRHFMASSTAAYETFSKPFIELAKLFHVVKQNCPPVCENWETHVPPGYSDVSAKKTVLSCEKNRQHDFRLGFFFT